MINTYQKQPETISSMNYEIILTKTFKRDFKSLFKKYRSLIDDLEEFKNELLKNPNMGDDLGSNTRKIRMAISSKNKGKSAGARVITFDVVVDFNNTDIYLLTIYDKGEQDTISRKEVERLKQESGLV
jgi:mRNA-degrading endonuclease RelE of RelBE toxin-antitoxin system